MIEVLAIDELVTLSEDIDAQIIGINIRANDKVLYDVVWWDGRTRRTEWVEASEIGWGHSPDKLQIGFKAKGETT